MHDAMILKLVRVGGKTLASVAAVVAVVLATQVLDETNSMVLSDIVYPLVAIGAGALMILGSLERNDRDRLAWSLFGVGVVLFGLGELIWAVYELVLGAEPPFPGPPDVFYLAAYAVLAAAMALAPRLAANAYQRSQQILDGIVVTAGFSMIAWLTVLQPMYADAAGTSLSELLVGAAYPLGDILLVATVGTVGLRRSFHLRDRSLWYFIAGLLVFAFGDIVYLTQSWAGTYASGGWVDSTWLAAYGLFALAAAVLPDSFEQRQARDCRLPVWYVLFPSVAVVGMMVVDIGRRISTGDLQGLWLEVILSSLGFIVLIRILLTVAEDRHLVDQERKRLISVVSHELRTPLTAIQGYLDLALTGWDDPDEGERREMIEIAEDQTRLVARIVTDLVAASRDNLHATSLDMEVVDVGSLLNEVLAASGLDSEVRVVIERPARVLADRGRLSQIVTNLLTNADRYGNGAVECVIDDDGGHLGLAIHDDGPGIAPRFREAIWGAFDRGSHRFDARTPGSGLGLAIVRSLVQAHNGQVGYRSSERLGGACFWVRIPLAVAEVGTERSIVALSPVLDVGSRV